MIEKFIEVYSGTTHQNFTKCGTQDNHLVKYDKSLEPNHEVPEIFFYSQSFVYAAIRAINSARKATLQTEETHTPLILQGTLHSSYGSSNELPRREPFYAHSIWIHNTEKDLSEIDYKTITEQQMLEYFDRWEAVACLEYHQLIE